MAEGGNDIERGSDAARSTRLKKESKKCFGYPKEFYSVFKDSGIEGLQTLISKKLDAWKTTPVNIAVVGRSGVGKSSFINAIRDLKSGDVGAALVGAGETTKTVQHYAYPDHENIVLWDLPGVGTTQFRRKKYERKVNTLICQGFNNVSGVGSFDIYLFLTANRFTEHDVWFLEKITLKYKKPYLFVCTNVKRNIDDEKQSCRFPKSDDEILKVISSDSKQELKEAGFSSDKVYLVDNFCPDAFDFQALKEDLTAKASELKFEALLFTVANNSERVIELKKDVLKNRLLFAASTGIENEVAFYKHQLGLTEEAISRSAQILGLDIETLINRLDLKSCKEKTANEAYSNFHSDIHGIGSACLALGFSIATLIGLSYNIPFLSISCLLFSTAQDYQRKLGFLTQMLVWCVEDAKKIQNAIIKSAVDRR